jgi:phosphatidylinositol 4-phosphatase
MDAFKKHFETQFSIYSNQIVVNLINKHGYESPLSEEFARYVELMKDERLR